MGDEIDEIAAGSFKSKEPPEIKGSGYVVESLEAALWAFYHTDSFREDDLIVELGSYNESPLQNLIYWVGTLAVDMVTLGKWIAVVGYGLTSALFFWIGHSMLGFRGGALASVFFTFFPDQFEYFAGGFSKAWMIPVILVCVYLLEKKAWRGLLLLMPFGAAAYPVSAVLTGGVVLAYLLLEAPEKGRKLLPALGTLAVASALALAVLRHRRELDPLRPERAAHLDGERMDAALERWVGSEARDYLVGPAIQSRIQLSVSR